MVLRYIYGGRLSLEEYDTSKNWVEQNFNLVYQTSFENDFFLKLQSFCAELMFREPEKVFNSIDFISLSEKSLISLIQYDNFLMNEIQVWEYVLKWGIAQNPELPSDPSSYSKDDFNVLKNTLQHLIPFIKFLNMSHKEFLDKVYPYKKILPKDLREKLIKHFIQSINNPGLNTTKEIDSMKITSIRKNLSIEKDFNVIVDGVNGLIGKSVQKNKIIKQKVIEYFSDYNINTQEFYNYLLKNQVNTNSIFLLGYFNFYGIGTSENNKNAFNLFIKASKNNHVLAQYFAGYCYDYGYGVIKNDKLAFKYYGKAANKNYAKAQLEIGYSYRNGVGILQDFKKAFYWYEKAANNGEITAIYNLGNCYRNGIGIEKDDIKAFELYKQSADGGHSGGIMMLGLCYDEGIGTKINKKKAFELYQNSANLGDEVAQNNLGLMYEYGDGITKDIDKAIYWYNKSAKQGYEIARNNLVKVLTNIRN
ncbi:kinase-like domain-containing protein [Rhizophagus clarus]|uniref:Kinase-like domain-containing protein n=1 Tax=Rhizophagus clarus TaxID=94130 RepID=A0A8H3R804_9GLOM|nr:kinase-like domain-containing protein [Rhizophagus clarus]